MLPEVAFDLPAFFFGEGTEGVGLLEVVEALAPWLLPWVASWVVSLVAHPGTAIPRESKYSRIFFKPNLIRPLTVPSGRSKSSAISVWVYPEKYASSSTLSCSGGSPRKASLTCSPWELRQASPNASLGCEAGACASTLSRVLRRLALERSWSMARLRTIESTQVRTLALSTR